MEFLQNTKTNIEKLQEGIQNLGREIIPFEEF